MQEKYSEISVRLITSIIRINKALVRTPSGLFQFLRNESKNRATRGYSNPRDAACLIGRRRMQIKSAIAGHERKAYNLIVEDKWAKRGGQLARSRQRAMERREKEKQRRRPLA